MNNIFFFEKITGNPTAANLEEIVSLIRSDRFKGLIDRIRNTQDKTKQAELKSKLPAFMPAHFGESRTPDGSSVATGIIQFDIDFRFADDEFEIASKNLKEFPYVLSFFASPREGLKILVQTDFTFQSPFVPATEKARYAKAYDIVGSLVYEATGLSGDESSRNNISQLCYVSHDPDAYFNPNCAVLAINAYCEASPPELPPISTGQSA